MRKRIWELDALRGFLILVMVGYHLTYDLIYLFGIVKVSTPAGAVILHFFDRWAGVPFVVLSGLCASFSAGTVKRGLQVLGCGLVITAVTAGIYFLGFADKGIIIYFGVLQCLGVCMLLWPALRKLKSPVLLLLGLMLAGMGLYLRYYVRVDHFWLIPLGVISPRFQSSDYYPLLPNLGYFLVGAFLGRRLYPDRTSLLPDMGNGPVGRALCFCGRNSLVIYMLHQPVLAALVGGWTWLFT